MKEVPPLRDLVETVLDLLGLLLLVAAAAVWAGTVALPLGLAIAGVGLLGVRLLSGVATRRTRRKTR